MFHTPYSQTNAKFLESGIIDIFLGMSAAFIRKHKLLYQLDNKAYVLKINKYVNIHIVFEDEFTPNDTDANIAYVHSADFQRTLYCITGQIAVNKMLKVESDSRRYQIFKDPEIEQVGNAYLVYRGSDHLVTHDSMIIPANSIVSITGDVEKHCMFATLNLKPGTLLQYAYASFYLERKPVIDIVAFKKRLRELINTIMAIARLQNHNF